MNPQNKQPGLQRFFSKLLTPEKGKAGKSKTTNGVTLSISFLLAVTLWFVVALNKQDYQTWYTVPVKLVNFPEKYQLTQPFPNQIEVLAEGHGIDLLMSSLRNHYDTIRVDFGLYEKKGQFIASDNLSVLTQGLPEHLNAKAAVPSLIHLEYEAKASRRIPVFADLDLKLPAGNRVFGKIVVNPDSVLVIGPEEMLDTLTGWYTERKPIQSGEGEVDEWVKLSVKKPFEILPDEVRISFLNKAFTEAETVVSIRTLNVPSHAELQLYPEKVKIKFLVPLDEYEQWQKKTFVATVDYENIRPGETEFLYPIITAPDTETEVILLDPPRVEFTVIRN